MSATYPIFDGHNDVLSKLAKAGGVPAAQAFVTGRAGAIDVPKARAGGFLGGFFAIWVPSPMDLDTKMQAMADPPYALPLPDPIPASDALPVVLEQAAILLDLEARGAVRICRSAADIEAAMADGRIAAIFHIEGAEALDPDLHALDVLHAAGLRSLGPVWSRPTIFGEGVPFCYPADPDIGGGLTEAGKRLVRRCNDLRILIDLSHLNAAGFRDVAAISNAPLVATHSNAHAITPHPRNLTDAQLQTIAASDGLVGLNFAAAFLRPDGRMSAHTGPAPVMAHLDHLIDRLGEDRVGLGSDYDGAIVPEFIANAAELPNLTDAMRAHGYSARRIEKLCHRNWLRVLRKTWGA